MTETGFVQSEKGCLLDTNVLSELTQANPDRGVIKFLPGDSNRFWILVVFVGVARDRIWDPIGTRG